jgi:RIO kinase 1
VTTHIFYDEQYESYEQQFDPEWADQRSDRRQPKSKRKAKKSTHQAVAELTDEAAGLEAGFNTTYQPARYETEWLLSALRSFYDLGLITDVLAQVKGGKEANVYRCKADPSLGVEFLAAKVYRPRKFRNLRNDKTYREGRQILKADGRPAKDNDHRLMRALNKKTAFGVQVAHTSWLMHEYSTLGRLHSAGAAVPKPIAVAENAILMGYVGDARLAAPTLHETSLGADESQRLFRAVLDNIELMLQHGLIHGDLSAYNILYWQGEITLIDFPQVTEVNTNSSARSILQRDVQRICEYFTQQGVSSNPGALANGFWHRYTKTRVEDLLADFSRTWEEEE